METFNETEIIKQLHNPKEQRKAFEQVVNQYSESLYWLIRRMVISHDDANDLLQNTFIKAWININQFRGESKISTWLYRIATNETLTHLKQQAIHDEQITRNLDFNIYDQLEAGSYFNGEEAQILLQKAILHLPEKQRLVFNLKYFEEMKYETMSQILGTSVGALKASYHLAVKKISSFLEEHI